jgi:hypothetical protein
MQLASVRKMQDSQDHGVCREGIIKEEHRPVDSGDFVEMCERMRYGFPVHKATSLLTLVHDPIKNELEMNQTVDDWEDPCAVSGSWAKKTNNEQQGAEDADTSLGDQE